MNFNKIKRDVSTNNGELVKTHSGIRYSFDDLKIKRRRRGKNHSKSFYPFYK